MPNKHLADMEERKEGAIISICGGQAAAKRLADLGLTPGTKIKILRKMPFRGPVEIAVRGSKLIIGRGLAAKILVEIDRPLAK